MTLEIREFMLAVSASPAAWIVLKATAVAGSGLLGWWAARRARAAVRHAVLAAAFTVLAVLPAASLLAPALQLVLPATVPKAVVSPPAPAATRIVPQNAGVAAPVGAPERVPLAFLLAVAWIAGAAIFLLPMAVGLWQVRSMRRSAVPWRGREQVLDALAREAGFRRRVELLVHEQAPGPMTCGGFHPAIVLSRDAEAWDPEELERALVHELEHARRWDWAVQCAARAVCGMYWFHPFVWMAWRRLALEAERACDDAVLGRSEATAYADQLVRLAKRLSAVQQPPLLAMASRSDLARRVDAVLDGARQRGRAGWLAVAVVCAGAGLLALSIAPLKVVAAQQDANQQSGGTGSVLASAETWLVIEDVRVLDARGVPVEGLTAKDFKLTQDGWEPTISVFEYQSAGDLSYYVLGYYTSHMNADSPYRKIEITGRDSRMAKLDYRAGYMDYAAINHGWKPVMPGPVTVPEGVRPPVILHKVLAGYSDEARKAKYQGTVILRVEVDETGRVVNIHVSRSMGLGSDEKAIEAMKQWRFKPAFQDGKPISMPMDIAFSFRLL